MAIPWKRLLRRPPNTGAPPPPAIAPGPQAPSPKPAEPPPATVKKTPPSAAVPESPKTSVEKNPPAPKPVEPAPPATPVVTPVVTEIKPPETPVDTDALLAGLKTLCVHVTNPFIPNPKAYLNSVVATQAKGAARQLGMELVEKDPNVMEVGLNLANEKAKINVVLSAELKCPAQDGKVVTVWKKSEKILSINAAKMNPASVVRVLNSIASKSADKFFEQFSADVKRARAKAGKQ